MRYTRGAGVAERSPSSIPLASPSIHSPLHLPLLLHAGHASQELVHPNIYEAELPMTRF
ncbi:hypothetical protein E2C01_091497 [Portunus trituberculatus]|uniref:Uncharacterized protein n=1 Tax=Portunus trituberculatus TaxID=210409 RepID=A0A5B7JN36_PORTR|nr:hypothetical protein [Portunus trituberculatus]